MAVNLGGWIHSFAVTETSTHKKGYTIYKITSIVFPRSVPEALTCVTVWKRFREIKRLYRELNKRHKSLHLRGQIPEPKEPGLFKRFEPEVIAERKEYILKLLDFAAQHPALYKSEAFLNFFETGSHVSETPSPIHNKGNIENICDNLDLPFQSTVQMIRTLKETETKGQLTPPFVTNDDVPQQAEEEIVNEDRANDDRSIEEDTSSINSMLQLNIHVDNDYIYEAAFEFSQAVQAEVNQKYKDAYSKYNVGIEKLLEGSKVDTNEDRKSVAKAKVAKYMSRVQEIYEQHLIHETDENKKSLHLSIDEVDSPEDVLMERPWNQLSKFKVIQIVDTVMQVQDVTNKSTYIMKTIQKPSTKTNSHSIFLPQNVPYMVKILSFFQSDSSIYLLLEHAKGGKLFDYIRTYTPTGHITNSLSEIFKDYQLDDVFKSNEKSPPSDEDTKLNTDDSGFVEVLNEYVKEQNAMTPESESSPEKGSSESKSIPSFTSLSQQMDVNDLVSCSQKLLQSVSNTLEQFKDLKIENKPNECDISHEEADPVIVAKSPQKTEIEVYFENNKESQSPVTPSITSYKHATLPEVIIKQWARELVIAIESLHLKGIVLGDLHSRNILLGSEGQLLLSYFYQCAGFDTASQISISLRALEGMYVAPERPLTTKSDWWSFGVILYELLTGYSYKSCHPAGHSSYYEIQYPDVEISETAMHLLSALLQQDPINRYNIDQIKAHEFFHGTSWDDLRNCGVN